MAAREHWSGRFGFLMASIGSAVGLGNFWRFPYLAGENGGGAFVAVYLVSVLCIILPLLIAEIVIGRRGGQSAVGSMLSVARAANASPLWAVIGWFGVAAAFLILSFYSVIGGWIIAYIADSAAGVFHLARAEHVQANFDAMLADPVMLSVWHLVFMALTVWIVAGGIRRGIEAAANVLMPVLFLMLVALVVYAAATGAFAQGVEFLFAPDFSKLTWAGVLRAIGQGFFSIGVGLGMFITFGAYLPRQVRIPGSAVIIAFSDTAVALMAAVAIFPIVFENGLNPGAGPGLMFVTLPLAFGAMPAGIVVSTLFFVLVLIAAITSSISLLEIVVARTQDRGGRRRVSAIAVGSAAWIAGIGTVLSFNHWSGFHPLSNVPLLSEKTVFDLIDYLTSSIMLPLGGILIALFAGWVMSRDLILDELAVRDGLAFRFLRLFLRFLCPLALAIIFVFNLGI